MNLIGATWYSLHVIAKEPLFNKINKTPRNPYEALDWVAFNGLLPQCGRDPGSARRDPCPLAASPDAYRER